jgi:hypothetical protein
VLKMGPRFRGDDADIHWLGWAVSPRRLLAVSTPRLLDLNSTEQSENVYENKQSRS